MGASTTVVSMRMRLPAVTCCSRACWTIRSKIGRRAPPSKKLPVTNHRRGVGHLARVDSAEVSIRNVALHLPFGLFEAPALEVLENLQAKYDLRGNTVSTSSCALSMAASER